MKNFRSIEDTGEFDISDVTCLVGKNESGKSATLQALYLLRPYESKAEYDQVRDYPRRFAADFKTRHPDGEAPVAFTTWTLKAEDKAAFETRFGPKSLYGDEVRVHRGFGEGTSIWIVPFNEPEAIQYICSSNQLEEHEKAPLEAAKTSTEAIKVLTALQEPTSKQKKVLERLKKSRSSRLSLDAIDALSQLMPKFVLFSHFDRMSGEISVNKLIADQAAGTVSKEDQIFLDFLDYASTSLEELRDASKFEDLQAKCEAASNRITDQIFEFWSQNSSLQVEMVVSEGRPADPPPFNSGTVVRARVRNTIHRASVPFSERSAGFIWFFSFLIQFTKIKKDLGNVLILLDEPGLTLHGRAQQDLLRYFDEKLKPHHQVIYSTHSPFILPMNDFSSIKVVEDVVEVGKNSRLIPFGTKVRSDVLVTDKDSLFPLQGALGYDITQTLFVGKDVLLVEGPSDIIYLQGLSNALKLRGEVGLDPRWTLCPSGGIDKIWPFVSLFAGNKLNVAVLTDQGAGDKRKVEALRRNEILKSGQFFTASDFSGKDESDIEDFFEPELFVKIVNQAYKLPSEYMLTVKTLEEADKTTPRQVKKAEAAFNVMPTTIPTFDHFMPAAWLLRNLEVFDGDEPMITATLGRARAAFAKLNALLE